MIGNVKLREVLRFSGKILGGRVQRRTWAVFIRNVFNAYILHTFAHVFRS